jgi:hypothetical protein
MNAASSRACFSATARHELGLTGTLVGCEHGVCGMCTILLDDRTARSRLAFAVRPMVPDPHRRGLGTVDGFTRSRRPSGRSTASSAALHINHVDDAVELRSKATPIPRTTDREAVGGNAAAPLPDHRRSGRACRPASRRRKGADSTAGEGGGAMAKRPIASQEPAEGAPRGAIAGLAGR